MSHGGNLIFEMSIIQFYMAVLFYIKAWTRNCRAHRHHIGRKWRHRKLLLNWQHIFGGQIHTMVYTNVRRHCKCATRPVIERMPQMRSCTMLSGFRSAQRKDAILVVKKCVSHRSIPMRGILCSACTHTYVYCSWTHNTVWSNTKVIGWYAHHKLAF